MNRLTQKHMKTRTLIIQYLFISLIGSLAFACIDNEPEVETLPSAAVAFTYEVIDNSYQLDYYVGANVKFTSTSSLEGECTWDFGDGTEVVKGTTVTHKYADAGTYLVKLTVADLQHNRQPILIKDIVPIMTVDAIEGGICEVLTTPVSISIELPNPENLSESYEWFFPQGTTDENGTPISTSNLQNPGKLKFSNVGSQTVSLRVKLGGRTLEEGKVNVQVAYNKEVPTLYYAVKGGNIMALKLADDAPAGMKIYPFNMGVTSGKHALNILFKDPSLYVLDCGQQFTYVDDADGVMGDGRITVMSKDGSKVETMLTNSAAAFDDPFYGHIDGSFLYFSNRNTGISKIPLVDRNKVYSHSEYPYYVQNQTLGYYGKGWTYGSMNACFTKIDETWYWCKTFNGTGIFRFTEADILKTPTGKEDAPAAGVVLSGMSPKSLVWDKKNEVIYFSIYDEGYGGLYRCTLEQLTAIGGTKANLKPYLLTTANGKSVIPITEPGKGEGSSGEFIGLCQLSLDESTGCVYFGLRSAFPDEVKSGLMRYNPAKGNKGIEHVIEGIEVYGVAVNNGKSKLF